MGEALLELKDVRASYGRIEALKGISLRVERGSVVTLIGANGAGKSTTLMTISGLLPVAQGTILLDGEPISGLAPEAIVARGVIQVPEGRRIFTRMSVVENLAMGAFLRRDSRGVAADLDHVYSLFPVLKERASQRAGTLSGGEQQMLAIGRGLMARPRLLLLDEPSLGLAPNLVKAIFEILRTIHKEGTTLFLVEQNVRRALEIAGTGYVIETGRIVLCDTPENLLCNDEVKRAYLGES
jgi:branched-chain amino acid transport system ATP-binding protein